MYYLVYERGAGTEDDPTIAKWWAGGSAYTGGDRIQGCYDKNRLRKQIKYNLKSGRFADYEPRILTHEQALELLP